MESRSAAWAAVGARHSRTARPRVTGVHWLKLVGRREASRQQIMVESPPGMMPNGQGAGQTIVGIFKGIKNSNRIWQPEQGMHQNPPPSPQISRVCHQHGAQWALFLLLKTASQDNGQRAPTTGTSVTRVCTNSMPAQELCGGAGGCRHKAARTSETLACPENPRKRPSSLGVRRRSLCEKQEPLH